MSEQSARFGPNQRAVMDLISLHFERVRTEKQRADRISQRVMADLIDDPELRASVPDEQVSPEERHLFDMLTGCLALMTMVSTLRQCEHYFRTRPRAFGDISRADHFRNCCEMYFDRMAQFKDRLKVALNAAKRYNPSMDYNVSNIVKAYDKAFKREIKARNHIHHIGRYDDTRLSQISLIELLSHGMPDIPRLLRLRSLVRSLSQDWVDRVHTSADVLDNLLEHVAGLIVNGMLPKDACPKPQALTQTT